MVSSLISQNLDDDVWTPELGINDFLREEFTCGGCYDLAVVLHEMTGWPIHGHVEDGHLHHAWVLNPTGKAVDINGIHSDSVAYTFHGRQRNYAAKHNVYVQKLPEPTILSKTAYSSEAEYIEWAKEVVLNFPEHFGISENSLLVRDQIDQKTH